MLSLLKAGADYRLTIDNGMDRILMLERLKMPQGPGGQVQSLLDRQVAQAKPVFDWLSNEGVNWKAAHAALNSPQTMANLRTSPPTTSIAPGCRSGRPSKSLIQRKEKISPLREFRDREFREF